MSLEGEGGGGGRGWRGEGVGCGRGPGSKMTISGRPEIGLEDVPWTS